MKKLNLVAIILGGLAFTNGFSSEITRRDPKELNDILRVFHKCYINKDYECVEKNKDSLKESLDLVRFPKNAPKYIKDDYSLAKNYVESVFVYSAHNKFRKSPAEEISKKETSTAENLLKKVSEYSDEEILLMDLYAEEGYETPRIVSENEALLVKEQERSDIEVAIRPETTITPKKDRVKEIKKIESEIISKGVSALLKSKEAESQFVLLQERKRNFVPVKIEFKTFDRLKRVNSEFIRIKLD